MRDLLGKTHIVAFFLIAFITGIAVFSIAFYYVHKVMLGHAPKGHGDMKHKYKSANHTLEMTSDEVVDPSQAYRDIGDKHDKSRRDAVLKLVYPIDEPKQVLGVGGKGVPKITIDTHLTNRKHDKLFAYGTLLSKALVFLRVSFNKGQKEEQRIFLVAPNYPILAYEGRVLKAKEFLELLKNGPMNTSSPIALWATCFHACLDTMSKHVGARKRGFVVTTKPLIKQHVEPRCDHDLLKAIEDWLEKGSNNVIQGTQSVIAQASTEAMSVITSLSDFALFEGKRCFDVFGFFKPRGVMHALTEYTGEEVSVDVCVMRGGNTLKLGKNKKVAGIHFGKKYAKDLIGQMIENGISVLDIDDMIQYTRMEMKESTRDCTVLKKVGEYFEGAKARLQDAQEIVDWTSFFSAKVNDSTARYEEMDLLNILCRSCIFYEKTTTPEGDVLIDNRNIFYNPICAAIFEQIHEHKVLLEREGGLLSLNPAVYAAANLHFALGDSSPRSRPRVQKQNSPFKRRSSVQERIVPSRGLQMGQGFPNYLYKLNIFEGVVLNETVVINVNDVKLAQILDQRIDITETHCSFIRKLKDRDVDIDQVLNDLEDQNLLANTEVLANLIRKISDCCDEKYHVLMGFTKQIVEDLRDSYRSQKEKICCEMQKTRAILEQVKKDGTEQKPVLALAELMASIKRLKGSGEILADSLNKAFKSIGCVIQVAMGNENVQALLDILEESEAKSETCSEEGVLAGIPAEGEAESETCSEEGVLAAIPEEGEDESETWPSSVGRVENLESQRPERVSEL